MTIFFFFIFLHKIINLTTMKKILISVFVLCIAGACFVSCVQEDDFDKALLIGKWRSGTLYYNYNSNGTGSTWDTSDDVTEEEAQKFEWSLDGAELIQIHIMEIGGNVPRAYTITTLTSSRLVYEDDFGREYSYNKVND